MIKICLNINSNKYYLSTILSITTRAERKHRRLDALSKLNTGWGVGDTIIYLVRDYKLTRRSTNLDVAWASAELCKNFDNTENTDMLAWLLTQIQRVAVKSEEDKQYGAAVGCYRLIYDLIFKDMKKKQSTSTFHGNCKR